MTVQTTTDTKDRARPATGPRRRRGPVGRPRTGALAAIGIGLLLFVGAGQIVAPRVLESGAGELAYAVWSNPVPAFLTVTGSSSAAAARGLVSAEPPRALGVPAATVAAARKESGETGGAGTANGGSARGGAGAASGSGAADTGGSAGGASAAATTGASAVARPPAGPAGGIPIRVYFSRRPESDATFTAVSPVKRMAPDQGVAAAALAELIDGPTTEERAAGYFSELGRSLTGPSSCAGRDFQITVRDGVATVKFCRALTSAGVGQDARVRAQIEATLTQFRTIRSVKLLGADGRCLFDQSGLNRCLEGAGTAPRAARASEAR